MSREPDVREVRHSEAKLDPRRRLQEHPKFFSRALRASMEKCRMQFLSPETVMSSAIDVRAKLGVVDVWAWELAGSDEALERCASLLSAAELARARRFFHERDRRSFVFSHGLLRQVLSAYCDEPGESLEFVANEFGKPALAPRPPGSVAPISFNLSHSHGRALFAVSPGMDLGVDLETEDSTRNTLPLAQSYFFGPEFEAIRNAPESQRAAAFFRFWTAKEAVIKAQARGLSIPLNCFHVMFEAESALARVVSFDDARLDPGWFVRVLACEEGWHAAVAARGSDWHVRVIDQLASR
jgi:4'-phosphopantetheinyl transferase